MPTPDEGHGPPGHDTGRSADALDQLVRGADAPRRGIPSSFHVAGRRVTPVTLAAGVVVIVVLALLVTQRRAAPADDRLPMADASSATSPSGASTAVETTSTSPNDTGSTDTDTATSSTVAARILVHVAGAVAEPGVVEVAGTARVVDAVHAAGGLRADADPDRLNLAAPLTDGQRVVVPVIGQQVPVEAAPSPAGGAGGSRPGDSSGTEGGGGDGGGTVGAPVDLNTADAAQLDELPGVGPSTAAAIISHREEEGPFTSVDSLLDVRGIGEAKLEALRDLVTVGG